MQNNFHSNDPSQKEPNNRPYFILIAVVFAIMFIVIEIAMGGNVVIMGSIIFVIIIAVVFAVVKSVNKTDDAGKPVNQKMQDFIKNNFEVNSGNTDSRYSPPQSHNPDQNMYTPAQQPPRTAYSPPNQRNSVEQDMAAYERDKAQTEQTLRNAGYGRDTGDLVDSVDSYSMSSLGVYHPTKCEEITVEDFNAKKIELQDLLSAGIINKKEHDMILREYSACLHRSHNRF